MKRLTLSLTLLIGLALLIAACGPTATEVPAMTEAPAATEPPAAKVALRVTGAVANEQAWTEDEVKAMDVIEVESTNSQGEASTYTGVLLSSLVDLAQPNADANLVVFVGDSTAEVGLEEVTACGDCIISFRNKGGFSIVMPNFPSESQVKGVVEIQIAAP